MSMISMQCDELRKLAKAFPETSPRSTLLIDSADLILELRDDLQRANDAVRDAEHDESIAWDRVRNAESENAKLREQVTRLQSDWESERDYADQMEAKEKMAVAENDKLRQLAKAAWIPFLKHGAVGPYELPEVDRVRESLNELEIKVSWEELGIEVEDDD